MNGPVWIAETEALAIHERLLALHGGAAGLRDLDRLRAALARPMQHAAYADAPDIVRLAAVLTAGIVGAHPFADGNKRTGFVLGVLFLELNGFAFAATQEDAATTVIALAAGEIGEEAYAEFLAANVQPAG